MRNVNKVVTSMLLVASLLMIQVSSMSIYTQAATASINAKKCVLLVGEKKTLKVKGTKETAVWKSSDKKIVKVSSKGQIRALAPGNAVITAKVAGKKYKCSVSVKKKVEISLEKAVSLGASVANKYYDDLKLTEVHSYDNDEYRRKNAGDNGCREWWYVNFANNNNNYVNVLIRDGKVYSVTPIDNNGNNGLFMIDDVKMSSKQAVNIAKKYGMRGGNPKVEDEWVSGYNFKLEYASFTDDEDEVVLCFEVIGVSKKGKLMHVDFDAATGEVLLVE